MYSLYLLLFSIITGACPAPLNKTMQIAMSHLRDYGYLTNEADPHEALRKYQSFMKIAQTGIADEVTMKKMNLPRCGMKDITEQPDTKYWNKTLISYRLVQYPEYMNLENIDRELKHAFSIWSKYVKLTFFEKRKRQDINILFAEKRHADDSQAFDGKYGVLAHANKNSVHFDSEEDWDTQGGYNTSLYITAAHEIGHALGLVHSNIETSIMYPSYEYNPELRNELDPDTIQRIQALYEPKDILSPTEFRKSGSNFDTILLINDKIYVVRGTKYYEYSIDFEFISHGLVHDKWMYLPIRIDAAFHSRFNKTYFFKGRQVWKYEGTRLVDTYPQAIYKVFPGLPSDIEAAFIWDGNLCVFQGPSYWLYNKNTRAMAPSPKKDKWKHQLNYAIGAIAIQKKVYIFAQKEYVIYDAQTNTLSGNLNIDNLFPQRK